MNQGGDHRHDFLFRVAAKDGYPEVISTDRGIAFSSEALRSWADEHGVKHDFQVSYNPASGSSERVLRALQNELHEGPSKVKAPGREADYARFLTDWVTRYNESKIKA